MPTTWTVVLPVKPFARAKSRLTSGPAVPREALAHAFFRDTLEAALRTTGVARVLVVTDDERAASDARSAGALAVPDQSAAGLNAAIRTAVRHARPITGNGPMAVLTTDLPALRPRELATVLDSAAEHPRAFLADHTGRGTTFLAAARPRWLAPAFEGDSRERHLLGGAHEITGPDVPGARLDVDTVDDLRIARRLGVGRHTRAALDPAPPTTDHPLPHRPPLVLVPEGITPHDLH
ncbi:MULTISPECIES: 2-phospho-L-lactate guanylyltransferase [unclassified Streptomyces]|uniref:2-phospho-L-lactate guanylyltransferase n=1 Tax=unclassified Streptomyces TaxID=2593676 RepID=UPI002E36BFD6|nr:MULTISPECIES: 2-phospho-L-lactate guanylyltransferase [unclassified Streptomyces]